MLRCLTLSICLLVFDALLQQGVHHAFGMEDLISHRLSLLAPCWLIQACLCLQVYDPLQPTRGIGVIEAESNGAMGVKWNIYATEKVKCVRRQNSSFD